MASDANIVLPYTFGAGLAYKDQVNANFAEVQARFNAHLSRQTEFNAADYGVTAAGSSSANTTALQAAIDDAAALRDTTNYEGGGVVVWPSFAGGFSVGDLSLPATGVVRFACKGAAPLVKYTGSGAMFTLAGAASPTGGYLDFGNAVFRCTTGRRSAGTRFLDVTHCDIGMLNGVRVKQFETAVKLTDSADWQFLHGSFYDCKTGIEFNGASGAAGFYGWQFDQNDLGFSVLGVLNLLAFYNCDLVSDASSCRAVGYVNAAMRELAMRDCNIESLAAPSLGADIVLDGGGIAAVFDGCHFDGHAVSAAAVKATSWAKVRMEGGSTLNHTASSVLANTGVTNWLAIDMTNGEATFATGTASSVPVRLVTESGTIVVKGSFAQDAAGGVIAARKGSSFQANKSDDTANVQFGYSGSPVDCLAVAAPLKINSGSTLSKLIKATKTWDPASVAAAGQTSTTVTATGAALGDTVQVSFSLDLQLMQLTGYVSAADTVTVVLRNGTAGAIDLASGTLTALVTQAL